MPLYDYKCDKCKHIIEDIYAPIKEGPEPTVPCPMCKTEAFRFYGNHQFMAISDTSSMYGRYHPGFGEVVRDYGHKKELLKKYDMIEAADATGGSKCYAPSEERGPSLDLGSSGWMTADELKSMGGQIDTD